MSVKIARTRAVTALILLALCVYVVVVMVIGNTKIAALDLLIDVPSTRLRNGTQYGSRWTGTSAAMTSADVSIKNQQRTNASLTFNENRNVTNTISGAATVPGSILVTGGNYTKTSTRTRRKKGEADAPIDKESNPLELLELHASLQEFYHIPVNHSGVWDDPNSRLPEWMKRYFRWHQHIRKDIQDPDRMTGARFLVMRCMSPHDKTCGGVSDRLKPLPLLLRQAYYTRRILLIYWDRPASLESFLVPPDSGLDWRAPAWLIPKIKDQKENDSIAHNYKLLRQRSQGSSFLIRVRFQDYHGGMYSYDTMLVDGEASFADIFHDVWKVAFTPSMPVRAIIESDMERLGLIPGQYVAAHLRLLYAMEDRAEQVKKSWTENALNCASELRPRTPIFLASDSRNATNYATAYASTRNATIRTRVPDPNPPIHMDKVKDWRERPLSDFYDAFVDLYVMAQAGCMTYNKGGYGIMALYIGRNFACGVRQDANLRPEIRNPCSWVDNVENGTQTTRNTMARGRSSSSARIYGEPMTNRTGTSKYKLF